MQKVTYRIVKYGEQQANSSPGVRAGMWSVVQTIERDFAFADSEGQAHAIKHQLEAAAKAEGNTVT